MDSFSDFQQGQAPRRRAQSRAALQGSPQPAGYRLSSDDLSVGLEVRTVNINTLPLDVVAELVRMRRLWDGAEMPRGEPNQG
jgi:hypothetical protein